MSLLNFDLKNGFPSVIETGKNGIYYNPKAMPEYRGERSFAKMKDLYKNAGKYDEGKTMYYTAGNLWLANDKNKFLRNEMTYEYTIIPPAVVNGELNKTHGHIHGASEKTGKIRCEAFEVLHGQGCFELFKEVSDKEFECLMVLLKEGDTIIVPSDYYHLSINTSTDDYFIFADLIKDDVRTVYSHVKDKHGGPYRLMIDDNKERYYELNENWNDKNIRLKIINCSDLNWSNPFKDKGLYQAFISSEEYISQILGQ